MHTDFTSWSRGPRVLPMQKYQLNSLDFVINRFLWSYLKPETFVSSNYAKNYSILNWPSVQLARRRKLFLDIVQLCQELFHFELAKCSACSSSKTIHGWAGTARRGLGGLRPHPIRHFFSPFPVVTQSASSTGAVVSRAKNGVHCGL